MNRDLTVFVDIEGQPVPCGRLWTRSAPRESAYFTYNDSWLSNRGSFALDPELPLRTGNFHTGRPLFRAFTDPAPDRWGQTLLRRAERARARAEGRTPRTLSSVDFLTLVDDETRLGALRFKDAGTSEGPFLSVGKRPIPPVLELASLLSATTRIIDDDESDDDLALVLAPGTSLGGARPKASVKAPDGTLMIAKFPRKDDEWPMTRWEATTLELAENAGITVPRYRLENVLQQAVLILERFDRRGTHRIAFLSTMTAVSAEDNERHSYLDILDALRREGSRVAQDVRELWRRMVFNILVSNTDDHLRNHGFLRTSMGWTLAPAYDLNPTPVDVQRRIHVLSVDETEGSGTVEEALDVAPRFGLSLREARSIAREVALAVQQWRAVGPKFGLTKGALDRMESAFEHGDLALALGG